MCRCANIVFQGEGRLLTISSCGGLIAAASKKASQPTLCLGDITVVKRIVLTFQQMGVFSIVVVTGVEAEEVKYQLAGRGVVFLHNKNFEDPELSTSVKMGLSFLQGKCRRIVFTPVNIPLFSPTTLRALLKTEGEIVTPVYKGRGGHPILLSDALIPAILSWDGKEGLRGAIRSMENLRKLLPINDKGISLSIHQQQQLSAYYERNKDLSVNNAGFS